MLTPSEAEFELLAGRDFDVASAVSGRVVNERLDGRGIVRTARAGHRATVDARV